LLGLNGLIIKSHGGADADGVAAALAVADNLARHPFQEEIKNTIAKVTERAARKAVADAVEIEKVVG
jgi:glycerol-3-phosphate acyltransferase PlsX